MRWQIRAASCRSHAEVSPCSERRLSSSRSEPQNLITTKPSFIWALFSFLNCNLNASVRLQTFFKGTDLISRVAQGLRVLLRMKRS